MKKAVIFDLDGTLTDTITAISHFGNLALGENDLPPIEKDVYKYLVGNGRDNLIHRMLKECNADTEENFIKVGTVYDKYYEADPLYKTDAYDGIREAILEMRSRGIKTAVCSNKPDNVAQDVIAKIFGSGYFDFVCGERSGVPIKPDAAPALLVAKELGLTPDECIFTGDTKVDMSTAKNANMTAIGVLWGFRDYDELKNSGADFIIKHPSEYKKFI